MPDSATDRTTPPSRLRRWLLRGIAVVALALVFTWYLSPHFAVDMAARFWSCI